MMIVEIAGNLGSDPEERHTPSGKRVLAFRVGVRSRKNKTVWWRVNVWEEDLKKIAPMLPYLKKGSGVIILGEMDEPETFVGKDGQQQISLTLHASLVKFSPFGKGGDKSGTQTAAAPQRMGESVYPSMAPPSSMSMPDHDSADADMAYAGDDLPF